MDVVENNPVYAFANFRLAGAFIATVKVIFAPHKTKPADKSESKFFYRRVLTFLVS